MQPGRCGDTSVDSVVNELHLEGLTQHLARYLTVSGASAAAEVEVLMDSGPGITTMSEELVEAMRGQLGMTQYRVHARVC